MARPTIACLGEITLDLIGTTLRLETSETATFLESLERRLGGRGANVAAVCAALGGAPHLLAAVGPDARAGLDRLNHLGVDTSGTYQCADGATAAAIIISDDAHSRTYFAPGILSTKQAERREIVRSWVSHAALVDAAIATGDDSELGHEFLLECPARLKVFAPAHAVAISPSKLLQASLQAADLTVINHHESQVLCSRLRMPLPTIAALTRTKQLVVTHGSQGCCLWRGGRQESFSASLVSGDVEATGAGDTFAATLTMAMLGGAPISHACKAANIAAASVLGHAGGPAANDSILNQLRSQRAS